MSPPAACLRRIVVPGRSQSSRARILGSLAPEAPVGAAREGAPVGVFRMPGESQAELFLAGAIVDLMEREPGASVGVVAANPGNARHFFDLISEHAAARLVLRGDFTFEPGIDVTDVDNAKGLEFDYVIIPDATASAYPATQEARRRLHVAATRASHQLWIVAGGGRLADSRLRGVVSPNHSGEGIEPRREGLRCRARAGDRHEWSTVRPTSCPWEEFERVPVGIAHEDVVAYRWALIVRAEDEAAVGPRFVCMPVDFLSRGTPDAGVSQRKKGILDDAGLDQDENERASPVTDPGYAGPGARVAPFVHDVEPGVLGIERQAPRELQYGEGDMCEADVGHLFAG